MTQEKKKAKELIESFLPHAEGGFGTRRHNQAKRCALICVDEIIKTNPTNPVNYSSEEINLSFYKTIYLILEIA